eukprot:scaffold13590_cov101-Isochrysis_galbana.AAC.2
MSPPLDFVPRCSISVPSVLMMPPSRSISVPRRSISVSPLYFCPHLVPDARGVDSDRLVGVDAGESGSEPEPLEVGAQLGHVQRVPLGQQPGHQQVLEVCHRHAVWHRHGRHVRRRQRRRRLSQCPIAKVPAEEGIGDIWRAGGLAAEQPADPAVAVRLEVRVGANPRLEFPLKRLQLNLNLGSYIMRSPCNVVPDERADLPHQPLPPLRGQRVERRQGAVDCRHAMLGRAGRPQKARTTLGSGQVWGCVCRPVATGADRASSPERRAGGVASQGLRLRRPRRAVPVHVKASRGGRAARVHGRTGLSGA